MPYTFSAPRCPACDDGVLCRNISEWYYNAVCNNSQCKTRVRGEGTYNEAWQVIFHVYKKKKACFFIVNEQVLRQPKEYRRDAYWWELIELNIDLITAKYKEQHANLHRASS